MNRLQCIIMKIHTPEFLQSFESLRKIWNIDKAWKRWGGGLAWILQLFLYSFGNMKKSDTGSLKIKMWTVFTTGCCRGPTCIECVRVYVHVYVCVCLHAFISITMSVSFNLCACSGRENSSWSLENVWNFVCLDLILIQGFLRYMCTCTHNNDHVHTLKIL